MRILQGSNEEIKSTFYVPKMNIKKAVKMVCLDIMSRQAQMEKDMESDQKNMDSVWTKCPNRRKR